MELDFGLNDLDGFPVRLDDLDMDLFDDKTFSASVPGSFQDFVALLARQEEYHDTHPMSSRPNGAVQPAGDVAGGGSAFQQPPGGSTAPHSFPAVPEQLISSSGHQQQNQLPATSPFDNMRQNSVHSTHSSQQQQAGSPAGQAQQHRPPPAAQDSFRSQPSCSSTGAGGLPDASLLLQQQQQQQQHQRQGSDILAAWEAANQQHHQQQAAAAAAASASAAVISAAAGKAQQLLMSASSGGGGFAPPALAHAYSGGAGGAFGYPGGAVMPSPQHAAAGGVLLSPMHGAAAVLQPAMLIGGGGGSAHPAAAAAMAAMAAAQHNPFAAAAAAGLPAMGLGLGLGGQVQGFAVGQQGFALHPGGALHSLVGHGVLKHTAAERQQKARKRITVASLEAEMSEKLAQLQLLSAENEMLKLRAGVLEATVQNREDQMRVVWEHGPPTFPIDCPDSSCALPGQQQQQQGVGGEGAAAAADGGGEHGNPGQQAKHGLGIAVGGSSAQLATMWDDQPDTTAAAAAATAAAAAAATAAAVGGGGGGPLMPTTPSAKAEPASSGSGAARTASNCSNLSAAAAAAAAAGAGGGVVDSPSSSSNCEGSGGSGKTDTSFDAHTALLPLPQQKDSLLSIKRMTDVDVIRHWKNFLQEVTSALVQLQREESAAAAAAAANPRSSLELLQQQGAGQQQQQHDASSMGTAAAAAAVSAAEQRVRDLVDKYCYLVRTSQTLNPSAYCRLFGRHLDTGETLPYNDNHWRNVVSVLGLSKDQVTHILACSELYFSSRAKLQAEQRALQAQLTAAELTPLTLLGGDADNPLRPWLERLGSNLKREHNLRIMLNSYVWGRIFTHVQKAKAAVYSHPLYVDIHALVCVMCEDALAAAGAPRGNAAGSSAAAAAAVQQQHLQQQQQLAAAYAACQQQQQQQMSGYMQFMNGHVQHTMV